MNPAVRWLLRATLTAGLAGVAGLAAAQATEGEVRRIDREQGKLTIRHGELKNLDMPAMTMVFRVADPKLLDGLTEGSKVRFDAEKLNGQYTVVRLVPVR
jgi:Cu/Ag efflux protein CusF